MTDTGFWLPRPAATVLALAVVAIVGACGGDSSPGPAATASSGRSKALEAPGDAPGVKIVALTKISETRISRTVYDYVFKITVLNDALARKSIMATIVGAGSGSTVLDGSVLIGDLSSGASVTPVDTITIRQDRTFAFTAGGLDWRITDPLNGVPVPPTPDPVTNASTLAGVDSNGDGVRDDVERLIALKFGLQSKQLATAAHVGRTLQKLVVSPSSEALAQHDASLRCIRDRTFLESIVEIEELTLNTLPRRKSYGNAVAGTVVRLEEC